MSKCSEVLRQRAPHSFSPQRFRQSTLVPSTIRSQFAQDAHDAHCLSDVPARRSSHLQAWDVLESCMCPTLGWCLALRPRPNNSVVYSGVYKCVRLALYTAFLNVRLLLPHHRWRKCNRCSVMIAVGLVSREPWRHAPVRLSHRSVPTGAEAAVDSERIVSV
ncbi:hypothetical protein K466DRAFT_344505 [Polyporus arcularius HHB13444]|uniref:Uncharacterized protein n=1 Tax=Polyporus arcularius HHB13444 TaxID=1314778 RepID=A0A5C3NW35_9APHY|nr:hypothetical protein K466DRAFT_344505 [Polyporus arcularius HHB13444]